MEDNKNNIPGAVYLEPVSDATLSRVFMTRVFSWMFLALTLSAVTAVLFAGSQSLMRMLINSEGTGFSIFGWIVTFAPFGFVLLLSFGFNKLSAPLMMIVFIIYSILMGMSLSFIFLIYSLGSIAITFGIAAGMFGVMAVAGYVTKTDLTKFGSLLMMALIGIIIASIVNLFMNSNTMGYIISIVGVLVFTGLTAYDVQKLKRIGSGIANEKTLATKLSIMGALSLYLDFINLFLFLLRLLGSRK
jgi:FtsH-binding integral membrane protein